MSEHEVSDCTTQVHTIETSVSQRPPDYFRDHLTRNCMPEIVATRQLYEYLDSIHTTTKIENFDACKRFGWFVRHVDTGRVKIASRSCKLRWCPLCSNSKKYLLASETKEWLETVEKPKFLTLTLKHSENELVNQIDNLYKSFRKLRLMKCYKKLFKGGVWFFQIKKSDKDDLWHPHLHCVIDSKYIDWTKLWKAWLTITRSSKVVDIRSVKDPDQVAEYVARYAARPSDLAKLELPDQLELVEALHGRRLVGTWGTARGMSLSPSKPQDADKWKNVGSWGIIASLFDEDIRAKAIWKAFKLNDPLNVEDNLQPFEDGWYCEQWKELEKDSSYHQHKFEFT
ncbi:hypothetical protein LCGC14_1189170 [marine sediment metagenome]|uniref:Replication protein n=1 Tax=marine sediment metagenome TaxID=412755 RepID=A0A0F9LK28_9ZZZZ